MKKNYTRRDLPSYRYIPGLNRRPESDFDVSSHGKERGFPQFNPPAQWRENEKYLYGVDLYNHAFWWEAHNAWEYEWLNTKKNSVQSLYVQGLIQIAAAFIKWEAQNRAPLKRNYTNGLGKLKLVATTHAEFMGLNLILFVAKLEKHFYHVLNAQGEWPPAHSEGYPLIELG